jgi:hypothetical protein
MTPLTWLSISLAEDHITLWDHKPAFSDILGVNADDEPSLVTFIGDEVKSSTLALLLGNAKPFKRHGSIRLLRGSCKAIDSPEIYADCEILLEEREPLPKHLKQDECSTHAVDWFCSSGRLATEFSGYVVSNILTPLSSVLCIFADDFGGFPGVASFLASQALLPMAHSLPPSALPHVLVVINASSAIYDNTSASSALLSQVLQEITAKKGYSDTDDAIRDIGSKFRAIAVHGFVPKASSRQRSAELKSRLATLKKDIYWSRRTSCYLFKAKHLTELSGRMITKLCTDGLLFNFLQHSRSKHFEIGQLFPHLSEGFKLMPGQHWLWRVIAPLMASAFFTASYPPESHRKSSGISYSL